MNFPPIDLSVFPSEREEALKNIYRFSLFKTVFYRSNLWMHSKRVSWIVEELAPTAQKIFDIDVEKARTLALVHDDAEIITGDVQAGRKVQMSKQELAELDRLEAEAAETLVKQYPTEVHGYSYKELLMLALHKDTLEAQLVSYADKVDAYNETMHEIFANNYTFITSTAFYNLRVIQLKYPALSDFLTSPNNAFTGMDIWSPMEENEQISKESYASFFKPHTPTSIRTKTLFFPFYDQWRKMVLEKGGGEGERWLLEQRETF